MTRWIIYFSDLNITTLAWADTYKQACQHARNLANYYGATVLTVERA